jgi:hypothetical protein
MARIFISWPISDPRLFVCNSSTASQTRLSITSNCSMVATKRSGHGDVEYRALETECRDIGPQEEAPTAFEVSSPEETLHAKNSSDDLQNLRRDSDAELLPLAIRQFVARSDFRCCYRRCYGRCRWLCNTKLGHFIITSVTTFVIGALMILLLTCGPVPYTSHIEPLTSDPPVFNNTVKVFLVGDSMWGIPNVSCA